MGKIIKFGPDGHQPVLEGVKELEKAVVSTLGPRGNTVIIHKGTSHPVITKDGVTVARAINFSDKWKDLGATIVKDAAARTNRECGDGTTTTILLASHLMQTGIDLGNLGFDKIDIKNGFNSACKDVIAHLDTYKVDVSSSDDILHIATISANNDKEIGEIIQEAFESVGNDGIVSLVNSFNEQTSVKVSTGYEMTTGFISSLYMNQNDDTYFAEKPKILLCKDKLDDINLLKPLLTIASDKEFPLIVIAPEYGDDVHSVISINVDQNKLNACLIRAPGWSRIVVDTYLEDLSKLLNCRIFTKDAIDSFNPNKDFGTCESIKVSSANTIITGPNSNPEELEKYCDGIRKKINEWNSSDATLTEMEVGTLKERLAKLSGGVATILIGASSEIEMKEKKDRYEDAVNAVRAAIKGGIVPGGGSTLAKISQLLMDAPSDTGNQVINRAYDAFLDIIKLPCLHIIQSTRVKNPYMIYEKVASSGPRAGFNAKTNTFEDDLIKAGIVDPILVLKTALKYATSVAGTFLTSNAIITDDLYNTSVIPNDKIMEEFSEEF